MPPAFKAGIDICGSLDRLLLTAVTMPEKCGCQPHDNFECYSPVQVLCRGSMERREEWNGVECREECRAHPPPLKNALH